MGILKKIVVVSLLLFSLSNADAQSKAKKSKIYIRCLSLNGVIDDLYLKKGKETVHCQIYEHAFNDVFTLRHKGKLYLYDVPNPQELKKLPVLQVSVPQGCKTGVLLVDKDKDGKFSADLVNVDINKVKWGSLIMYNKSSSLVGCEIGNYNLSFKREERKIVQPKKNSMPLKLYFGKKPSEMSVFYTGGISVANDQRLFCFFVDSQLSTIGAPTLKYVRDSKRSYDLEKEKEKAENDD